MKKIVCMYILGSLTIGTIHGATNTTPKWLSSKIINTTNVPAQITFNFIPDCSKITLTKDKNECLAQGGSTLTLKLDPSKSIVLSDILSFVNVSKQCPQAQGTFENSIQVSFPTDEPGTKTFSPLTVTISSEDLQKVKTYYIRLSSSNVMSIK